MQIIIDLVLSNPVFYGILGLSIISLVAFFVFVDHGFKQTDEDNKNNPNY